MGIDLLFVAALLLLLLLAAFPVLFLLDTWTNQEWDRRARRSRAVRFGDMGAGLQREYQVPEPEPKRYCRVRRRIEL